MQGDGEQQGSPEKPLRAFQSTGRADCGAQQLPSELVGSGLLLPWYQDGSSRMDVAVSGVRGGSWQIF